MRLTKDELLGAFARQEEAYFLGLLATYWLRGGTQFTPSASDYARSMTLRLAGGRSFAPIAAKLDNPETREAASANFVLQQLHSLIRAPFELTRDYCEDYDKAHPDAGMKDTMKATPWYWMAYAIRNAVSHNFRFDDWRDNFRARLPVTWRAWTITAQHEGTSIEDFHFGHRPGYELFHEMRVFVTGLTN